VKAARRESPVSLLWAGVFLTLNALVDWNYFVYCCWFILFAYLYLAIRRRRAWLPDIASKSVVVAGSTLVILSPLVIPMLRAAMSGLPTDAGGHNRFVVDLMGFFIPFADHPLAIIDWVGSANQSYTSWAWENTGYLGIVAIALVIVMWKDISGVVMPYVIGAVSFVIMSLGAQPHLFGWPIPVLVPGRLVPMIPLLSNSRAPSRNVVFAYLFWSIIVAVAAGRFLATFRSRRIQIAAGIVLVALLAFDYTSMSHETTPVFLPKCYAALQKDAEPYGLLDLPLGYQQTERYMMYQSMHGIPIVEGWVSRKLNRTLVDTLSLTDLSIQRSQLKASRVKYVVVHKGFLPSVDIDSEAYRRTYSPVYEDDQNIVFKVY
ncbi:MAG: hypothetical protein HY851_04855, partial [candidate division Zixibacteria bacterium]|nr:hypothetical protein [candidate division Zixibacteria bacterium]